MANKLLLGLDMGTQGVKGTVVRSTDGQILARVLLGRGPMYPRPGWVEMGAERDWWGSSLQAIQQMLSNLNVPAEDIAAIGVSGLVPSLCPVDIQGQPLRPAILSSDNRAMQEMEWINGETGLILNDEAVLPKLLWLKQNEPDTFARTHMVLSAHNYVVYRLTGKFSVDPDTANRMGGLFNAENYTWHEDICEKLGIPAFMLPPVLAATEVVGGVSAEAARVTGLKEGTPVITGSGDIFPTIVGCGAVETGDAMISFGATGLLAMTSRPLVELARGRHLITNESSEAVVWGANVLSVGSLVRWFSMQFASAERAISERIGDSEFFLLETEARRIPPGSDGLIVLPHWQGRRTPTPNPLARGAALGFCASHTSAHFYRAILEAFAYNVRQSFENLRPQVKRLVGTAGGATSPVWRQIMADVLETPLEYHTGASAALGIAFLAGYGVELIEDFSIIKNRWLRRPLLAVPNPRSVEVYRRMFRLYCEYDRILEEPFAHLADLMADIQEVSKNF